MKEIEAREVWGHIWREWGNERLCFQFYEHQRWHKQTSWLHAIRTAKERGATPRSSKYLETIALEADDNGIKSDKPVQRGNIGDVKYVPTYAQTPTTTPAIKELTTPGAKAAHEEALAAFRKLRDGNGRLPAV